MNEESVQVKTTAYSDIGTQRKANEDSYFVAENENLLIVCDGMGGHVAGGLASKIAVETIKEVYFNLEEDQLQKLFPDIDQNLTQAARLLVAAVRIANRRLYNMAAKFPKLRGMGTTVVAIAFDSDAATLVHVGDSRVFRISDDAITQLTEDHSWLNELIEDNEINEEQIETFSQKNV
ncbi:protein phosphatase 2C domain-containing protein, partial [bacterium]|nr:protein phosphatase 2C domain-containing protein [bacterium]